MNKQQLQSWLLLVVLSFLFSCKGAPEFDLLDINFQKNDVFELVKKQKHATYDNYVSTDSEKFLFFSGLDLSKNYSAQNLQNFLTLYYNKSTHEIFYYSVYIGHRKTGKALLEALKKKFGEADYVEYEGDGRQIVDFEHEKPFKYIWEDKNQNRLFILYFADTDQIHFNVMVNPSNSQEITGMAQAGYWNEFVDKRAKKKNPDYTYSQYIKDELSKVTPSVPTTLTRGKTASD